LAELKDKLLAMAALSQQAVQAAVDAWLQRDEALCQYVRENETAINTAQREVDEMAYELLSREQPMAIDLRFILAVIKINGDLERIGDMAVSIAIRTLDLLHQDPADLPVDIAGMGDFAGVMIRTAVQALLDGDALVAESVRDMDDEIDRMNRVAITDLTKVIQEHPETADQALPAILISRNLERIADHATNIATDVIFWVRGADLRHQLSWGVDRRPTAFRVQRSENPYRARAKVQSIAELSSASVTSSTTMALPMPLGRMKRRVPARFFLSRSAAARSLARVARNGGSGP
jgi:phosphate transport system protein